MYLTPNELIEINWRAVDMLKSAIMLCDFNVLKCSKARATNSGTMGASSWRCIRSKGGKRIHNAMEIVTTILAYL